MRKPIVALVGRPNVGKSTLFNRLIGEQKAVTSDIPGTTRDRLYGDSTWGGVVFTVVDTGGIEVYEPRNPNVAPLSEGSVDFVAEIRSQALIAIDDADVILFLVDAVHGITAADEEVAEILRRADKPVIVVANKADNDERRFDAFEFYALGLGEEVYPISALHGTGTGDMLDAVVRAFRTAPPEDYEAEEDESLKVAIVGRPNVGKSSLVNRLLGHDRVIVSPIAGTTRDAIDTHLTWEGMSVTLIDTAGVRRRGSIDPGIERFSVIRTLKALERADVALLLLDATEGITAQDTHIGGIIQESHRSVVIVVNKWDAIEKDEHTLNTFTEQIRHRFDFLDYAPILFISAKTGQRIHTVLPMAARVQEERLRRIPTSALNQLIRDALERHAPPSGATGRRLKIFYGTQVRVDPPTFLFHINSRDLLHFTYERYLENRIREAYGFLGTPLRLSFRERKKEEDRD